MTDFVYSPGLLVYLAGAFYILGLVIIHQVVLRLLILSGTGVYLLYYFTVANTPLWEAIYVSFLIGMANIIGLTSLLARKSRFAIPRAHADIYGDFPPLPPGDFRALMKLAKRYTVEADKQVTTEGEAGDKLYFVISGSTLVRKSDQAFVLAPKLFLGEVAFLVGAPSSASTWLEEGAEVLEWNFSDLRRKCARSTRFKLALEAAISADLAHKVAHSMGKDSVRVDHIPKPMIEALPSVRQG
ncbi:cyclic nucleotide-binding domain-containing protein [uncultured Roseobacter sp.]|uniref:Crp/Fnr family transcriptional regulator n=1 Tax=uncultured Roseobacter sp. TaxID=114847 RepID=UPI00262AA45E|nr:cyclic nucleotide-binding domain-containing protein [uncultured Roseobacter sp.]